MAAPVWSQPRWIAQVPKEITYAREVALLKILAGQAGAAGCRIVGQRELGFDARQFADLVIERVADGARLMFGLVQKGPNDRERVDISTRPDPSHAVLRIREGQWRLLLASTFLHPEPVEKLGLEGLLRVLVDDRA